MAIDVRNRSLDDELLTELERAWEAPTVPEPEPEGRRAPRASRWRLASEREAGTRAFALVVTWAVVYVGFVATEQLAGSAPTTMPGWWEVGYWGFWIAVVAGAVGSWLRRPHVVLSCSALLGCASTIMAVGCAGTGHHPTHFWMLELAVSAALIAASGRALVSRR